MFERGYNDLFFRYYFTLEELILKAKNITSLPSDYLLGKIINDDFKTITTALIGTPTGTVAAEADVNTLWCKYLAPYHLKSVVLYVDNKDELTTEDCKWWWAKLIAQLQRTYVKYKKLIDSYTSEATKLLDDVQIKNVSKFNDTPQVPQVSGSSFEDDDFMSTLTVNLASSQDGTKARRLDEIRRLWTDMYVAWCDEFKELFLDEGDAK